MNLAPLVANRLEFDYSKTHFDLDLRTNLTFISSKSGEGKSMLFNGIQAFGLSGLNTVCEKIKCFNYTRIDLLNPDGLRKEIRSMTGRLIVIDNADMILDPETRRHIAFDCTNQYIIIGRVVENLMLTYQNECSLKYCDETHEITLDYD